MAHSGGQKVNVNTSSTISCASSTFSCATDLSHKPVVLYTSSSQENQQNGKNNVLKHGVHAGGGGNGRKQCLWFSRDYGPPIFAMHSNRYSNSECFIIDTAISVLRILPSYQLILYKDQIHVIEDQNTKATLEFKDGSDSFAIWIQICAFQNVEPFSTTSVQLTNPVRLVPLENHLLRSSLGPTPASSWLTMKFKAPPSTTPGNKSSIWFTFARMQLLSVNFKKWRYLVLLLKSDDTNDDAPPGLFCIRPGVTCLKTGSQFYYEPCDGTKRKYILEFNNEPLCEQIWNYAKLVTPRDYEFQNNHPKPAANLIVDRKRHQSFEVKRKRRLQFVYNCFGQIQQEVKKIMNSSKNSLQDIVDLPEIHIHNIFFNRTVWAKRFQNLSAKQAGSTFSKLGNEKLYLEIMGSYILQCNNVKLHMDIVKMLMKQRVPAELIAEYREALVKRLRLRATCYHCQRIHCLFI